MTFGLSEAGLSIMRLADIREAIIAKLRDELGDNDLRIDEKSLLGVLIGIFSEREALLWELLEEVYGAAYPLSAPGVSLERVLSLVGMPRLPPTATRVVATLTGTPATVIAAGKRAKTAAGVLFALVSEVTIPAEGEIDGTFDAVETGPIPVLGGSLVLIDTPVSGWTGVENDEDGDLGRNDETDAAYRARMARMRRTVAGSSLPAMLTALSRITGVDEVLIVENRTSTEDSDGRPPHSFEVVVDGDVDEQEIADKIWETKPSGIETVSTATGDEAITSTVIDSRGDAQEVHWSKPIPVPLWVVIEYQRALPNRGQPGFPEDGEDQIVAAILAYEDALPMGADVVPFGIEQLIETPGIRKLNVLVGATADDATEEPYSVGRVGQGSLDSTRILFRQV